MFGAIGGGEAQDSVPSFGGQRVVLKHQDQAASFVPQAKEEFREGGGDKQIKSMLPSQKIFGGDDKFGKQ